MGNGTSGAGLAHLFGDYVVQSDWMANAKTSEHLPAALHGLTYAACFLPLTRNLRALAIIGGTHYVIDRWRLAKYLVWARNQIAPAEARYAYADAGMLGNRADRPDWLSGWLAFIADNACHLAINAATLRHYEGDR